MSKGSEIVFTGIIEEVGMVKNVTIQGISGKLEIEAETVLEGTIVGDSIAVNGVCLTVTDLKKSGFTADVMAETLRRSSLGELKKGSHVNLERAMSANGRFGGHIVSGHIDGIGTIAEVKAESNAVWYTIDVDETLADGIVEKGSITIDGISLTVAWVEKNRFAVSIIPHTQSHTILNEKKKGDIVNIETDIIGKHVMKLMGKTDEKNESKITMDFLGENGFL